MKHPNYRAIIRLEFEKRHHKDMSFRVRSLGRRNELKPVRDFTSLENLTSVYSQLFTCAHMN